MANNRVSNKRILPEWIKEEEEVWMLFGVKTADPIKVRKFKILSILGNAVQLQPEKGEIVIGHVNSLFRTRNECRDAKKRMKTNAL